MILRALPALAFTLHAAAAPVEITPPDLRAAQQPQVSIGERGDINVVFGRDGSIYHSVSTDEAGTFRPPVKIGALPELALGMHRGPRLAAAGERLVVSAISHQAGDLLAWTSADGGKTWTGPATVNTVPKSAREGLHALAASGPRVAVAWLDLRGSGTEIWFAISTDGGSTWQPDARLYQSPDGSICQCCAPSLAFGPRGELAAMWRNSLGGARDLYTALSRDGGGIFAPTEKLGVGTWKLDGCPMDGGGIAFPRAGGAPLTVWRRDSTLFQAQPGGREESLGAGRDAVIAATARGPTFAWQAKSGLMLLQPGASARVLDPKGTSASLAASPDGHFAALVWESGEGGSKMLKAELVR